MSSRSLVVVCAVGLVGLALVGNQLNNEGLAGQWTPARQWSSIVPWSRVAQIAVPPVPLEVELERAATADAQLVGTPDRNSPSVGPTSGSTDQSSSVETPQMVNAGVGQPPEAASATSTEPPELSRSAGTTETLENEPLTAADLLRWAEQMDASGDSDG